MDQEGLPTNQPVSPHTYYTPLTQQADAAPKSSCARGLKPLETLPCLPGRIPLFYYYIVHISVKGFRWSVRFHMSCIL